MLFRARRYLAVIVIITLDPGSGEEKNEKYDGCKCETIASKPADLLSSKGFLQQTEVTRCCCLPAQTAVNKFLFGPLTQFVSLVHLWASVLFTVSL